MVELNLSSSIEINVLKIFLYRNLKLQYLIKLSRNAIVSEKKINKTILSFFNDVMIQVIAN